MEPRRWALLCLVLLMVGCAAPVSTPAPPRPTVSAAPDSLRLFLVRSGNMTDFWSTQVRIGLLEALAVRGYSFGDHNLELREFPLNAHRHLGEIVDAATLELAVQSIFAYDPDVLLLLDDEAAVRIAGALPESTLPMVVVGLSVDEAEYGLERPNILAIHETVQAVPTLRLARTLSAEELQKVTILSDVSLSGAASARQAQQRLEEAPEFEVQVTLQLTDSWEGWQRYVEEELAGAAHIVLLGQHAHLFDAEGRLVPEDEVLRWTLRNAPVPVFGLWLRAVQEGAAASLALSPYEQGWSAGGVVEALAHGAEPAALLPLPPVRSVLAINVAALEMEDWNLRASIPLLRVARIYSRFP